MSSNSVLIRVPKQLKLISMRRIFSWVRRMRIRIQNARTVAKQRRRLAQLDSAQLKDIGISRSEAYAEYSRAFWDVPKNDLDK